jgi:uroporphyrinogen decarboxylase
LRAIARIRKSIPRPFRIVMTVFNPISILGDMVPSDEVLIRSLREEPNLVHAALRAVTTTFIALAHEFRNAGADGLFFATTQWASADRLNVDELRRFALPYDREVWAAAGDDAFNVLHVCEANIHLAEYRDFRAGIVNWDVGLEGNPSLLDGHALLQRAVMGGISHNTDLVQDSVEILRSKVRRLVDEHSEIAYAVGPGCAIPVTTPDENVAAVRAAVERN